MQTEFPSIKVLSTLSPIPGFMNWLRFWVPPAINHFVLPPAVRTKYIYYIHSRSSLFYPSRNIWPHLISPGNHLPSLEDVRGSGPFPSDVEAVAWLFAQLQRPDTYIGVQHLSRLERSIVWLGAHYLAHEKQHGTMLPLDSVARFHLRYLLRFVNIIFI